MLDIKAIKDFIEVMEKTKKIDGNEILTAVEEGLAMAYKRQYGKKGQRIKAKIDLETGDVKYFQLKEVVDDAKVKKENDDSESDEEKINFSDNKHILLSVAKLIKADAKEGDFIPFDLEVKDDFNRVAALSAKQTLKRKLKEIEKEKLKREFGELEGEIVSGTVVREENRSYYVELKNQTEAVLPFNEQIPGEVIKIGEKIQAYLLRTSELKNVVELRLSRTHPDFLNKLFEREVPELRDGSVEIYRVVREPGKRSKVAVFANVEDIDPVGTLIGHGSNRVNMISLELNGEKIDVVEYFEDPEEFIRSAFSPAEIEKIEVDEDLRLAKVLVRPDQFSLAVGRGGENVKLVARLTSFKIDVKKIGDGEEK